MYVCVIKYINNIFICVVLKAISEDSPTVPTLLTDYILKGITKFNLFLLNAIHVNLIFPFRNNLLTHLVNL